MSRKEREKKLARLIELEQERQAAEQRRKERLAPAIRAVKKLSVTVLLTLLIIAIGMIINGHLNIIATRIGNN